MRKLKFHEKKLLKKVNLYAWKQENNLREIKVMRRYHVQNRDDYVKYNRICGMIRKVTAELLKRPPSDPYRIEKTELMLCKLYDIGVINSETSLVVCEKVTVAAFCRRRLSTMLVQLKFCQTMREAVTFIEHGHVRVGIETITDPAYLVTRDMEDHISWLDSSKIARAVRKYNDTLDDFDLG
eukprot:CAMPEP_0177665342 /NCGR_PEP_ID=MMETSP0447-20121125/21000_1 /TAXON_ID=0 /ORGANISM="Stygamoeba regulata, Strain BSH-02190019" /LENGTH=181 /DNA_ID=CAMNT_0019171423 /DNA_START=185 /DNA_END=726 /DNA_ORIENTATION=+